MIIPADFSTSVQFLLYFKKWELELQMIHYGWDLCNKDDVEILLAIRKKRSSNCMENKGSTKWFKQMDTLGKNYRIYILSAN